MVSAARALLSLFHGQTENGVKESALKRNKSCLTNGESANQLLCVRDQDPGLDPGLDPGMDLRLRGHVNVLGGLIRALSMGSPVSPVSTSLCLRSKPLSKR